MALTRLLATGSAQLSMRLSIEGLAVEPVSDPSMEQTLADGRRRVYCIDDIAGGLIIDETVNLPEAKLEGQGANVSFFETEDEDLSQVFFHRPDLERYLTANAEVADTALTMFSTDGITADDVLHIGTEAILVGTVASSTSLTGCTRGYWDTTAQKHWAGGSLPVRLVANRPTKIRGRRVRVYLYEDGNDPAGDGTQIWLGHVETDPTVDEAGTKWRLQIGSIAKRLESKVGGDLEAEARTRGIYYTAGAGLFIRLVETVGGVARIAGRAAIAGFFETQREFCEYLTAVLAVAAANGVEHDGTPAALLSTYRALETDDGRWTVEVVVASTVTVCGVFLMSEQDGMTSVSPNDMLDADGERLGEGATLSAGDVLQVSWAYQPHSDCRLVPRGYFGTSSLANGVYTVLASSFWDDFPATRVYIDGAVTDEWDAPSIKWPDGTQHVHDVTDLDAGEGWVLLRNDIVVEGDHPGRSFFGVRYGAHNQPLISRTRRLADGNLMDLRSGLVAEGVEYANRGTAPFITGNDLGDWSYVVQEVGDRLPFLTPRMWTLATAIDLAELLSHEWRLHGVFPVTESDGRIGLRQLGLPNVSTAGAIVIDDEIVSVGWSTLSRGNQTINRVVLKTGYDPREDEWTGGTFDPFDVGSYADDHVDRVLEIEPRSTAVGESRLTTEDVALIAMPVLGLFGQPHAFVDVHVSWKLFGTLLGDVVSFSAEHLPHFSTGLRPIDDAIGIVVGRRWSLIEPSGRLRILISFQNVAGYSPTARVDSQVDNGGDEWTITVDHEMYAPKSALGTITRNTDAFFAVGDKVRVVKYDSETASQVLGTVTTIDTSAHEITVQFDATWTPGSDTWELMWQKSDTTETTQNVYAQILGTGNLEGDNPGTPHIFAP